MSPVALLLVLAAAAAHAAWNLLAKRAGGGARFVWLYGLVATVAYAPVALASVALAPGRVSIPGVGFMAGSGVLHAAYFVCLQRGYATGDLSLVYPLARGTGPLISVVSAVALLGERPGGTALVGAGLVVASVLSLIGGGRHPRSAVRFALATGALIGAYTLWDAHAVEALRQPPIAYYWGSQVAQALVLAPVGLRDRAALAATWRGNRRAAVGVGVLSPIAYILVLFALTLAPVSLVAPARESSIVIGALLGAGVLGETDPRRRLLAATGIVCGVALLAL